MRKEKSFFSFTTHYTRMDKTEKREFSHKKFLFHYVPFIECECALMKITTQFDYAVVDGAMGKMLRFFCAHREEHDRSRACVQAFFSYFFLPNTAATKFLCSHLVLCLIFPYSLVGLKRKAHNHEECARKALQTVCSFGNEQCCCQKIHWMPSGILVKFSLRPSLFYFLFFIPFTHNDNTPAD